MKKYYNLNEGYLSKLDDNNETLISAVDVDNIDKYSKIEKDDKQSFEDFKTQYKGVIDMKCTQDYGNCEDKDLWEDCAKELFLTSKNYLLQGDEYKAPELEKKTEDKSIKTGAEKINDAEFLRKQAKQDEDDWEKQAALTAKRFDVAYEIYKSRNKDNHLSQLDWKEILPWDIKQEIADGSYFAKFGMKVENKLNESSDRYQLRKFPSEQEYKGEWGAYDTKEDKFVQKGSRYVMKAAIIDLNRKDSKTESKINDIIANNGILDEIKTFNDKTIRDSFLNMCELEQISIRNQIQVLQECRRLTGKEPLTESNDDNYTNQDIRKAIKKVLNKGHGIFTDDSIYDVAEVLTGISDIDKMPKNLLDQIRSVVDKDSQRKTKKKLKKEDRNNKETLYMLLDRLKTDCEYFLGNGNGNEKQLWAKDIDEQIAKMKELYNSFADNEKPEWITMDDINNYEKEMKEYNKKSESYNNKIRDKGALDEIVSLAVERVEDNKNLITDFWGPDAENNTNYNDFIIDVCNSLNIDWNKLNVFEDAYIGDKIQSYFQKDIDNYEKEIQESKTNKKKKIEGTTQKRIARYGEFDNGYVLHNDWKEMSDEEAEELAKQASIKDPTDVYYVKYDDIMNPSNDIRWYKGKSYTVDEINEIRKKEKDTLYKKMMQAELEEQCKRFKDLASLTEDQYENERRKGRPSIEKIAKEEYYDNEEWYKNHIKDYKDVDDFIKQEIFEIAGEYNLKEDAAIQTCKEIYNLAIKNQSKTESFKITDPRDKRKKLIVPDKIENVLESSKFKDIKNAIKKHDGIISNPRIYVNDNKLSLNYSFNGFNDEEHMKVFSDLGFNDFDAISNGQLHGWGYSQYEASINIEGISVIISYSTGVRIISIQIDYPLKEDTANNEPFYRYDNQENFEKAKREYQRNPNEETLKAFKDARSAFEKEINAKKE